MAYIEERTNSEGITSYRVMVRLKGHPIQCATFERKTDAKKWAQDTESNIRAGRHFKTVEAKKHTLKQLIERYKKDHVPQMKSAKDRIRHLEWWKDELGDYMLSDIRPSLIVEYKEKLLNGALKRGGKRSPGTTNRYLAAISHVFTIGMKEYGWVEENPLLKITKPKEPRGRVRFLSDEERKALLDACKTQGAVLYTVVVMALSTGARKNEIMSLRWKDVDLKKGAIILHDTKNGERRTIPLQGHALALVKDLTRHLHTDMLFPSRRHPKTRPIELQKLWEQAIKDAGIEDFRFHDLRHSAASYLAMNGASIAEIAAVLGHKTLEMVKRYAHLSEAHTSKIVATMNKKIFG